MSDEIVIISAGARTPLGFSLPASAAAVRAGISVIGDHPFMIDRFGQPMKVTRDTALDPIASGIDREVDLATSAALEALKPVLENTKISDVTLMISTGEDRPGKSLSHADSVYDGLRYRLADHVGTSRGGVIAEGHSGGLVALHHAARALATRQAELCLVGGVDSYLVPETLEWLDEGERLHSDGNKYGFCPGEAAGFCLMARKDTANRLGLHRVLRVVATEVGKEENLIGTETICLGEGLGSVLAALRTFLPDPQQPVDRILCDMNGERYRGNEYGFAVMRSPELFRDAAGFETPADCWGDLGAATGPACVGLIMQAHERGYAGGPLSVVWGSSDNGSRAAVMLSSTTGGAHA